MDGVFGVTRSQDSDKVIAKIVRICSLSKISIRNFMEESYAGFLLLSPSPVQSHRASPAVEMH